MPSWTPPRSWPAAWGTRPGFLRRSARIGTWGSVGASLGPSAARPRPSGIALAAVPRRSAVIGFPVAAPLHSVVAVSGDLCASSFLHLPIGELSAHTPHPSALAGCTWPRRRLSFSSHAGPLHAVPPPDPMSSSSCIGAAPTLRAPPGPAAASLSGVSGSPSSSSPHPSVPLRANPVAVPLPPHTSALCAAALPNLTLHPAPLASVSAHGPAGTPHPPPTPACCARHRRPTLRPPPTPASVPLTRSAWRFCNPPPIDAISETNFHNPMGNCVIDLILHILAIIILNSAYVSVPANGFSGSPFALYATDFQDGKKEQALVHQIC
ncbi:hypothetical protein U9M48_001332 [Paspalum notatum var. saurae]|uniref:Uncharacterized protein n=1 Tax=Paspalum notatum var. saurae TaxID=547442 RepID=A0AAQ3SCV7_PASNO